ncbi:MAG: hypothetical protein LIP11_17860 [Clostridiales bacterium]|nr:hypothetical protein [Clostridiales bacterium]
MKKKDQGQAVMGYVLTIYSETVYQEYILPAINNADYTITLSGKLFSLREDRQIHLEVFENQWRFAAGKGYKVQKDGKDFLKKICRSRI